MLIDNSIKDYKICLKGGLDILIVSAPYYKDITENLKKGAKEVLTKFKIKYDEIHVPGALEIPTAINLTRENFSGFIALGCVIRGETSHYDSVCTNSSAGISRLGLQGVCIGNGILNVENSEQAIVRADPFGKNVGGNAALAVLTLLQIKQNSINIQKKVTRSK